MIAHLVEFHGPAEQLETEGMRGFQERVVPVLRAQPGFEGCLTLLNREHGRILGLTLWDTEENGRLAGARLEQERRTGMEEMSAQSRCRTSTRSWPGCSAAGARPSFPNLPKELS